MRGFMTTTATAPICYDIGDEAPTPAATDDPCGQYISNNKPSRFIMLSESEESLARQRFFALAQHDRLESASADSQYVFFEMYCPLWSPLHFGVRIRGKELDIVHRFATAGAMAL